MSNSTTAGTLDYRPAAARPNLAPVRLSVMMFLQYAVWGLWLLLLPKYLGAPPAAGGLGFTQSQTTWIMVLAGATGAILAPFIAGQIADRYINAERVLGGLLLIGGAVNFGLAYTHAFVPFLLLSILYSILYMPTLSLTNSVAFQNLSDPARQFPPIRVSGTIGWAVAAGVFPFVWLNTPSEAENTSRIADALKASGALSILYGLYCILALPKTPPKPGAEPLAFVKAFGLLRHPGFLVVTLIALPVSMIHMAFFYRFFPFLTDPQAVDIPSKYAGFVTSIGQYSEIFFLAILGLLLKRIGFKWVMILGALAYALRFAVFGLIEPWWLIALAQALHGMCYAFFYAAAFIYVETVAPSDVRHSAQTVFGMIILGVGPVLAGFYNQAMPTDYRTFWWIEAAVAAGVAVVLLLAFREVRPRQEADGDLTPPVEAEPLPPGQ